MAGLVDLHKALAGRLQTIDGLRPSANPVEGATPPCAWPQLVDADQATFSRDSPVTYVFNVYVLTGKTVRPQDGYAALMEYADPTSPKSIRAAIWDGYDKVTQSYSGVFNGESFVLPNTHVAPIVAGAPDFRVLGAVELDAFQMYGGVFAVTVKTTQE